MQSPHGERIGLEAATQSSVFVVLHLPPAGTNVLPRILSRAGRLSVYASDGEAFEKGCIYVAPPDQAL
jgi:two-component system, chemotaxis family, protein-glutamate methylesterase/glutaminase